MVVKGQIQIDYWPDLSDVMPADGSKDKEELETALEREVGCR